MILYADQITGPMQRAIAETIPPREAGRIQHHQRHHAGDIRNPRHIMNSVYERDHVLVEIGDGGMADDVISNRHNFETC